jgi:superfamily II DNA/RNA helicase
MSLTQNFKRLFKKKNLSKPKKPLTVPLAPKTDEKKKEVANKASNSLNSQEKQVSQNKQKQHLSSNQHSQKTKQTPTNTTNNKKPQEKKKSFSELGLDKRVLDILTKNQFKEATQVQAESIPVSLKGRNIFCSSQTGSGKTLAFLLPMIHKLLTKEVNQALVICPTREIAIQTQKVLQMFLEIGEFKSGLVVGGTDMWEQKRILQEYPEILVATPGRLLDMINSGLIWLQYTGYVVLDEADRMLDMGFERDLVKILQELTGEHQTLLFSATLFPEIMKLVNKYVSDYHQIKIGSPRSIASSVNHTLIDVEPGQKIPKLIDIIFKNRGKMIVFFNTINEADKVFRALKRVKIRRIDCLHSRRDQHTRECIINEFRSGELTILLASDVAARGVDIPNVELVVNYDLPKHSEEYIHRVGRTGRAGKKGKSVSFYTPKDKKILDDIEKLIKSKIRREKPKPKPKLS